MFPLPRSVQQTITLPLQEWATASAVFCLETFGFQVVRVGNTLEMNGVLVAVAEACNGLRMLTAFFVVSGFVVLMSNRPRWQKAVVLVSSIPIGLLCNTLRLAVTAVAFTMLDSQKWEKFFHDYGGLAMMPLALFLVVVELYFLSRLVVVSGEDAAGNMISSKKGRQKQ
jgi:exosortase